MKYFLLFQIVQHIPLTIIGGNLYDGTDISIRVKYYL